MKDYNVKKVLRELYISGMFCILVLLEFVLNQHFLTF